VYLSTRNSFKSMTTTMACPRLSVMNPIPRMFSILTRRLNLSLGYQMNMNKLNHKIQSFKRKKYKKKHRMKLENSPVNKIYRTRSWKQVRL